MERCVGSANAGSKSMGPSVIPTRWRQPETRFEKNGSRRSSLPRPPPVLPGGSGWTCPAEWRAPVSSSRASSSPPRSNCLSQPPRGASPGALERARPGQCRWPMIPGGLFVIANRHPEVVRHPSGSSPTATGPLARARTPSAPLAGGLKRVLGRSGHGSSSQGLELQESRERLGATREGLLDSSRCDPVAQPGARIRRHPCHQPVSTIRLRCMSPSLREPWEPVPRPYALFAPSGPSMPDL